MRALAVGCALTALIGSGGCNLIDLTLGHHASVTRMVPGDWLYIARNDKLPQGQRFGIGDREAEMTRPETPPPLGEPTKVRFPLRAKRVIENAPETLYLEADLYWGGVKQDSRRAPIEHIYSRSSRHGEP